jgi:AGCS family alanine or glycine:cation symporter
MVQANSVSRTFCDSFGINPHLTGIVLVMLSGAVMLMGAGGIVKFAEKTVPVMSCLFMGGCAVMLFMYRSYIPECISLVMKSAFSPQPVAGAVVGHSVRRAVFYGAKRGLFSNEAGMGTSSHAYAMVKDNISPHEQGLCAMICVFFDTMFMMTLTAFSVITVVLCAEGVDVSSLTSTNMTLFAFRNCFGANAGNALVSLCLLFFAFTSIVGWSMYGRINFEYLFGNRFTSVYYAAVLVFVYLGSISTNSLVWNLADLSSLFIVVPNVISLVFMYKTVVKNSQQS